MKMTYKGRTVTSGRALANAITRDIEQHIEREVRRAGCSSGVRVRKTSKGFEVEGEPEKIERFYKKLEK